MGLLLQSSWHYTKSSETVTELLEGRYEERDAGNDKNIITQMIL